MYGQEEKLTESSPAEKELAGSGGQKACMCLEPGGSTVSCSALKVGGQQGEGGDCPPLLGLLKAVLPYHIQAYTGRTGGDGS